MTFQYFRTRLRRFNPALTSTPMILTPKTVVNQSTSLPKFPTLVADPTDIDEQRGVVCDSEVRRVTPFDIFRVGDGQEDDFGRADGDCTSDNENGNDSDEIRISGSDTWYTRSTAAAAKRQWILSAESISLDA